MTHDDVIARSGDFSVIERLGDVHPTFAVVGSLDDDLKAVCKAAAEVERLRKARIVFDRYGIDYLGVRRSIDRKVVVKEIFIQPRLVRKLQIAARADGSMSCPEKSLQKRVNLMQKNQGRILYIGILYNNVGAKL